jgi:hypothetical protein
MSEEREKISRGGRSSQMNIHNWNMINLSNAYGNILD